MLRCSPEINRNYAAQIVQLNNIRKHPDADRLRIVSINFSDVIIGETMKEGDIAVYFPVECQINSDFLSFTNSFAHPEKNADLKTKGYFNDAGRVRAVKLRGIPSIGCLFPLSELEKFLATTFNTENLIGLEFDYWDDIKICEKYVVHVIETKSSSKGRQSVKRISRLIENQFYLHNNTSQLQKNIHDLKPDDWIGIHEKKHGCLPYRQTITMADGSLKRIKDIKVGDNVLGFNHTTNSIESTTVLNVFTNGKTEEWYKVRKTSKKNNNGKVKNDLVLTGNHKVFSNGKYTPIEDCKIGDKIITTFTEYEFTTFTEYELDYMKKNMGLPYIPMKEYQHEGVISSIEKISSENYGTSTKYDIETETHNFFAGDILIHNSSWVVGNVLVKKELKWHEKVLKKIGVPIEDKKYDIVYSSRNVVKNEYETQNSNHFYSYDIWSDIKDEVKDRIPKGWTLYGEVLGYTKNNVQIQKGYDYGCKEKESIIYVYRITVVNADGLVINLDDLQIEEFCEKNGFNYKRTFLYYGKAKDLYPDLNLTDHWHENFLSNLRRDYTEKDCWMCNAKNIPNEGIVIRINKLFNYEAYKCKSFRFLKNESEFLDLGIDDGES